MWGLRFCLFVEISRGDGSTQQPQRTEPCQCVSGHPGECHRALKGQTKHLQRAPDLVELALGAAAGLGRWFMGRAVLLVCRDFKSRRQHWANTVHRALPVCEWPALGISWGGIARSNAASAVYIRRGGPCTGGCGRRSGQVVF